MTKKYKILFAAIATLSVVGFIIVTVRDQFRPYRSYPPSQRTSERDTRDKLEAMSVSPGDTWKIKQYRGDSNADGTARHYIVITNQKVQRPAREIDFAASKSVESGLRWKNNNTVYVYGQETDVSGGVVLLRRSVSPEKRWQVEVSDIYTDFPGKRRMVHTWAIFTDLHDKQLTGKTLFRYDRVPRDDIRWKSANVVDLYGRVINVRKLIHGIPSK